MKQLYKFCAAALMIGACGIVEAAPAAKGDFVTVNKTHFARKGQAYYIVGANFWYGGYLGVAGGVGERARLLKELDNMKAIGINNLRVLAVSEKTDMKSAVRPATTNAPGQYDEELLTGLDFLMAEVAKRDMTVVLYLNNFWQWSGGMTQYLNWFEGTPALDPNVTKDYDTYMQKTAGFYRNAAAQAEYRNVIAKIVKRVNTITGKPYTEDTHIMSWQLANEPRPGNGNATPEEKAVYVKWIDDVAGYIHSLDRNSPGQQRQRRPGRFGAGCATVPGRAPHQEYRLPDLSPVAEKLELVRFQQPDRQLGQRHHQEPRLSEFAYRAGQETGQADRAGGIWPGPRWTVVQYQVHHAYPRPLLPRGIRDRRHARAEGRPDCRLQFLGMGRRRPRGQCGLLVEAG